MAAATEMVVEMVVAVQPVFRAKETKTPSQYAYFSLYHQNPPRNFGTGFSIIAARANNPLLHKIFSINQGILNHFKSKRLIQIKRLIPIIIGFDKNILRPQ